jgi:hypothetical protein
LEGAGRRAQSCEQRDRTGAPSCFFTPSLWVAFPIRHGAKDQLAPTSKRPLDAILANGPADHRQRTKHCSCQFISRRPTRIKSIVTHALLVDHNDNSRRAGRRFLGTKDRRRSKHFTRKRLSVTMRPNIGINRQQRARSEATPQVVEYDHVDQGSLWRGWCVGAAANEPIGIGERH